MQVIHYKKGEEIDCLSIAGQDFDMITDGNINIECYEQDSFIQIPNLESKKPGSGKLDELLRETEDYYKKPLMFVNFVNAGLEVHLRKLGYNVLENTEET